MSMDEEAWQRWSGQVNRKLAKLEPLVPWAQCDAEGVDVLTDVLARVIRVVRVDIENVRREAFENYNIARVEMGLQPAKPRRRVPAGTGRSW